MAEWMLFGVALVESPATCAVFISTWAAFLWLERLSD